MSTMQAPQATLGRNAVVSPRTARIDAFNTIPPQLPPLHVLKHGRTERIHAEALEWQRRAVEARARSRERRDIESKTRLHAEARQRNARAAEEREWDALLARVKAALLAAEEAEWTALRVRALAGHAPAFAERAR